MSESVTLTVVFTPDENGWTAAQLAEDGAKHNI